MATHSFDIEPAEPDHAPLSADLAGEIAAQIETSRLGVTPTVHDGLIRVSGKSKDDLQETIRLVEAQDYDIALTFGNYQSHD